MSESSAPARSWRTAVLAGMASYLDAGMITGTGVALVIYAPTLGLDAGHIGALSGILTLVFAFGAIIGGRLGDRFGRRRVFTFTLGLYAIGALLLASAFGDFALPMLYTGVIVSALAIGADLPVSLALIAEEAPEGRKGRMVVFSSILWLAGIVATYVLSILVAPLGEVGGRIMYLHLLVVALIVLVARSRLRESQEWATARSLANTDDGRIEFSKLRALAAPPVLIAVIATGLYYAIWSLGANTMGQFGVFLVTTLAGTDVGTASLIGLLTLPIGFICGFIFMRIVDNRRVRQVVVAAAAIGTVLAFAAPLILGPSLVAFVVLAFLACVGSTFAGEGVYKVWSQELFPTLVRGTAQGVTLAVARFAAGPFAFITPILVVEAPSLLFGILVTTSIAAGVIAVLWIPRLPLASQLTAAGSEDTSTPAAETVVSRHD